jgi:hypothetical protein
MLKNEKKKKKVKSKLLNGKLLLPLHYDLII